MIYRFKIQFNILEEAEIVISGLEVEPTQFAVVGLKLNRELTDNQIKTLETKIRNFFNNKFNLTSIVAKLIEVIK